MGAQNRPCPSCRGDTTLEKVQEATGREDPLAVTLRGLPVLRCGEGHVHFTAVDFPLKLLEHLVKEDEKELPHAQKKGIIFKHFHCEDCNEELQAKPDHRHVFEVEMKMPDVAPFIVDLSMPVYKCGGCGKQQIHNLDELKEHTPGALARAFEAAGVQREA